MIFHATGPNWSAVCKLQEFILPDSITVCMQPARHEHPLSASSSTTIKFLHCWNGLELIFPFQKHDVKSLTPSNGQRKTPIHTIDCSTGWKNNPFGRGWSVRDFEISTKQFAWWHFHSGGHKASAQLHFSALPSPVSCCLVSRCSR